MSNPVRCNLTIGMQSHLVVFLAALVLFSCVSPARSVAAKRPNVIVIMSDDQGGGDYGFIGNELIRTPQLDAMHARSGLLSNFYASDGPRISA